MTDRRHIWILLDPGANRFNDEYNLWRLPGEVFSTREAAVRFLTLAVGDDRTLTWKRANAIQPFEMAEDDHGHQWALARMTLDPVIRGRAASRKEGAAV